MMQGMWPYYDKAIGVAIKEAVEPMMEQYKPPGLIKKIYFSKLTFGDAPFRIDNVWVEDEGEQHVLLEVRRLCAGPNAPWGKGACAGWWRGCCACPGAHWFAYSAHQGKVRPTRCAACHTRAACQPECPVAVSCFLLHCCGLGLHAGCVLDACFLCRTV